MRQQAYFIERDGHFYPQVRATRTFEQVNGDVCGPLPESLLGNKYTFLYSVVTTRPDIAFAVNLLSQACKSPTVQDFVTTLVW